MLPLTKHVISGPNLHSARPLALREFLQHLPAKCKRRPNLSARPWHCPVWQIRRWLLHYVHKKLNEGLRYQLLGQKPLISPWLYVLIGWKKLN